MVTESLVSYQSEVSRAAVVAKQSTHQEVDFTINIQGLPTSNPRAELSTTILQNGRWDTALEGIEPRMVTGYLLDFDYQDRVVFEAGKEFRNMDISSLKYRSENVEDIFEYSDGFSTILFPDEPLLYKNYIWRRDLNGQFVPFNRDYDRRVIPLDSLESTINLVNRYNYREQNLGTEYTEVLLTLDMEPGSSDVYVVGAITDWKLLPEYRMVYDETISAYTGRLYLKQGYYNYAYAVPDIDFTPNLSAIEGNWEHAENDYTILTYYRPRGGLYDQLVGAHTLNSTE